jgi:hypothetical protein
MLAREDASNAFFEVFREGTEPKEVARPEEPKATDFYRFDL